MHHVIMSVSAFSCRQIIEIEFNINENYRDNVPSIKLKTMRH